MNVTIKIVSAPEISDEINENADRGETDKLEEDNDQNTSDWFQLSANIYDNTI